MPLTEEEYARAWSIAEKLAGKIGHLDATMLSRCLTWWWVCGMPLHYLEREALHETLDRLEAVAGNADEEAAFAVVALSEALSDVSAALAAIGILSNHLSTYFATVAQAAQPSKE